MLPAKAKSSSVSNSKANVEAGTDGKFKLTGFVPFGTRQNCHASSVIFLLRMEHSKSSWLVCDKLCADYCVMKWIVGEC